MHTDRTNRAALVGLGVLLLAAGVGALLLGQGVFGDGQRTSALFANPFSRYVGTNGSWLWPVAAIACALLTLLVLRWLVALLVSTDRAREIAVRGEGRTGRTSLRPAALADALSAEITAYRGVESVAVRTVGDPAAPRLVVAVTAARSVDLGALCTRIECFALVNARQALGRPDLPVRLDLDVGRHPVARLT